MFGNVQLSRHFAQHAKVAGPTAAGRIDAAFPARFLFGNSGQFFAVEFEMSVRKRFRQRGWSAVEQVKRQISLGYSQISFVADRFQSFKKAGSEYVDFFQVRHANSFEEDGPWKFRRQIGKV